MADFLRTLLRRNRPLFRAAVELHVSGRIPPNTYVVDQDAVIRNAELVNQAAARHKMRLYFMSKQFGRNPAISKIISKRSIRKAVAVDFDEALVLKGAGVPIGNVGHIAQIPTYAIAPALRLRPEVITVYSLEKAEQISKAAARYGITQKILVRVIGKNDFIYPGQEGGVSVDELDHFVQAAKQMKNIKIVGVTSFPCLEFDETAKAAHPTQNLQTIMRAADAMKRNHRIDVEQINAPGLSCCSTMELLSDFGATHAEPGHSLTGTTPLHLYSDQPEIPAYVYVSEISHKSGRRAFCFGYGLYARHFPEDAVICKDPDVDPEERLAEAEALDPNAILYYAGLRATDPDKIEVGDTVVFCFRTQMFVTHAKIAVVSGIGKGTPYIRGIYRNDGLPSPRITINR